MRKIDREVEKIEDTYARGMNKIFIILISMISFIEKIKRHQLRSQKVHLKCYQYL